MLIKFEYNYSMEFCLKTYSILNIKGTGEWDVNEYELADEFCNSDYDFEDFLNQYFYIDLDISGEIQFNPKDIKELQNFCEQYKKDYELYSIDS